MIYTVVGMYYATDQTVVHHAELEGVEGAETWAEQNGGFVVLAVFEGAHKDLFIQFAEEAEWAAYRESLQPDTPGGF